MHHRRQPPRRCCATIRPANDARAAPRAGGAEPPRRGAGHCRNADLALLEAAAREAGAIALGRAGDARARCARSPAASARSARPTSRSTACCARALPRRAARLRLALGGERGRRRRGSAPSGSSSSTRSTAPAPSSPASRPGRIRSRSPRPAGSVAGVVHLPALGRTYAAARRRRARGCNGAPIAATAAGRARRRRGARQRQPARRRLLAAAACRAVERHFRPSLAYRLCLVAEGRFDATLTFRDTWEWDVAGRRPDRPRGRRRGHRPAPGRRSAYNRPRPLVAGPRRRRPGAARGDPARGL